MTRRRASLRDPAPAATATSSTSSRPPSGPNSKPPSASYSIPRTVWVVYRAREGGLGDPVLPLGLLRPVDPRGEVAREAMLPDPRFGPGGVLGRDRLDLLGSRSVSQRRWWMTSASSSLSQYW